MRLNTIQKAILLAQFTSGLAISGNFDYENSTIGLTQVPSHADSSVVVRNLDNKLKTAGYVSDWAQYSRGFSVSDIEPTAYTDLVYSFFGICGDKGIADGIVGGTEKSAKVKESCDSLGKPEGSIVSLDHWGSFQSANNYNPGYPWSDIYDGKYLTADKWSRLNAGNVRGLFGELIKLKTDNPNVNIGLSIGGWTLSEPFHRISADATLRNNFADSIVEILDKFEVNGSPLFSNIDIDWEFPGLGGESGAYTENDGDNFVLLAQSVRNKLDQNGYENVTLSTAVGATSEYIEMVGKDNYVALAGEHGLFDNIFLMNYDYWGAFDNTLGHQTNLYGNSVSDSSSLDANSADAAIKKLESYGVEKSRILLGVANYSRGKQGTITVEGKPFSAINVQNTNVFGTWESSVLEGYDLFENIAGSDLKGVNGFSLYTDEDNNADYYYNNSTGVYYSIDTPRTVALKTKYARENGLAGVFVWTVEQDYKGITVDTINNNLGHEISGSDSFNKQQITEFSATCGVNLDDAKCDSLGLTDVIESDTWSKNYSHDTPSGNSSVYFYVKDNQSNVVSSTGQRKKSQAVWSGKAGKTEIVALATGDDGQQYEVAINGYKKFGSKSLRMEDGFQRGYGQVQFIVDKDSKEYQDLPKGQSYKTKFLVVAQEWHGAQEWSKQLEFNVDFYVDVPDEISIGNWSKNYSHDTPSGNSSVYFYVKDNQSNVISSTGQRKKSQAVWSGKAGKTKIVALATGDDGQQYKVAINGYKKFGSKSLRMEDGVQRGYGQVKFVIDRDSEEYKALPEGLSFKTQFTVIAQEWHDKQEWAKELTVDVSFVK
ncbi:MAG: hypothetical protein HRU48_16560 [Vibrio sp.]|uniref:glycoside hydrolase family 18 protein n=1 Tax=Vibrio TaxID=662 RepID=UPI001ED4BCC7|nr:glycosyl hydrolase family 18 protein [Vibrio sp.]NRB68956.1 hypothetical protein [Vibrio sp.]